MVLKEDGVSWVNGEVVEEDGLVRAEMTDGGRGTKKYCKGFASLGGNRAAAGRFKHANKVSEDWQQGMTERRGSPWAYAAPRRKEGDEDG